MSVADIAAAYKRFRSLLVTLAAATQTLIDDKFLALVDAIVDDPVIGGWLFAKSDDDSGTLSLTAETVESLPEGVRQALVVKGIDVNEFISALGALIALWRTLRGK